MSTETVMWCIFAYCFIGSLVLVTALPLVEEVTIEKGLGTFIFWPIIVITVIIRGFFLAIRGIFEMIYSIWHE